MAMATRLHQLHHSRWHRMQEIYSNLSLKSQTISCQNSRSHLGFRMVLWWKMGWDKLAPHQNVHPPRKSQFEEHTISPCSNPQDFRSLRTHHKRCSVQEPCLWNFHPTASLKLLGKSVGLCKTTKRKDQLYISLPCFCMENHLWKFQSKRTHISWDMNENINKRK